MKINFRNLALQRTRIVIFKKSKFLFLSLLNFFLIFLFSNCSKNPMQPVNQENSWVLPIHFDKIKKKIEDSIMVNGTFWPFNVKGGDHPEGHPGFDFKAGDGDEIIAVQDGYVTAVKKNELVIGSVAHTTYIVLQSIAGNELRVTYQEMKGLAVKAGEKVKQGDVIGYFKEFETGNAMFHFDVRRIGKPKGTNASGDVVCPLPYFNEAAREQLDYLLNHSRGNENGFIDSLGHYTSVCF